MWRSLGLASAICLVPALSASAQLVEVAPFVGVVVPLSNVIEQEDPLFGELAGSHEVGPMFGGRLTLWFTDRLGLEGQAAYAFSNAEAEQGGESFDCADIGLPEDCLDASIFFGAAKLLYRLVSPHAEVSAHLGGGPAVISRSGNAYDSFGIETGKTDIGGLVNLGVSFRVSPRVFIRVDAEDYISSAKFTNLSGLETDSKLQNDLTITAGVQIRIGG
jgi:Outer membrane protein beta-barrel domain